MLKSIFILLFFFSALVTAEEHNMASYESSSINTLDYKTGEEKHTIMATSYTCPEQFYGEATLCIADSNGGSQARLYMTIQCFGGAVFGAELPSFYVTTGDGSVSC